MQFIDLIDNVGSTYNGDVVLNSDNEPSLQDSYIFWFPEGQSTGIFYVKPICFISDNKGVSVELENNNIFSLLNTTNIDQDTIINDVKYIELKNLMVPQGSTLFLDGEREGVTGKYIYMFYILCHSTSPGEYISKFYIDNKCYLVGADFYEDNEVLYINASNNGIELPVQIQSAIYGSNVREENTDNILLNRKLKELLSNSWDVVSNKGSYKSLINSLKWFEYGDLVKIREIWKHEDFAKVIYEDKDINSVMSDTYESYMRQFSKTTNYALHMYLQSITGNVDDENNPILENIVTKWSLHDMMLKMSLLGAFYEAYFMPIHLNLIQSTIVDTIFMNNLKLHYGAMISRRDNICNIYTCECNIKDNDVFFIGDVNAQVGPDTLFGLPAGDTYDTTNILGVDKIVPSLKDDTDLKQFYSQLFNSRACIIPVSIKIKSSEAVIKEVLSTNNYVGNDEKWIYKDEYKLISSVDGEVNINFNILYKNPGEYHLRMQFTSLDGSNYIKNVNIRILSQDNINIKLYRISEKDDTSVIDNNWNYMFSNLHIPFDSKYNITHQYLSTPQNKYVTINDKQLNHFNHVFVVEDTTEIDDFSDMYNIYNLPKEGSKDYYIYISKKWDVDINNTPGKERDAYDALVKNNRIIKSQYEYIPFYHQLINFGEGDNIDDYIIRDGEMMCFVPEIKYSKLQPTPLISEWEIVNASNPSIKYIINGSMGPISGATDKIYMPRGYYDVIYKFKSDDFSDVQEVIRRSAFIKQ